MISYVLPTRNRPEVLARTLEAVGALPAHAAEAIVVDNASTPAASVPRVLLNGVPVRALRRGRNEGAAARNAGVAASDPRCEWVVMLDDDSHPMDADFLEALREQPRDVAAVCAEIFLPSPRGRESGGLPEVPIGCGVAYRREAFMASGGYDARFLFYAEEYDLAARLIRAGLRIVVDRRFRVLHEKTPAGRSMNAILRRLVRNNAWVLARYAPEQVRGAEIRRVLSRYAGIARRERALAGYTLGAAEALATLAAQRRTPLDARQWDRFTGKAACRDSLGRAWRAAHFSTAAIVAPGKNHHIVREVLEELGVRIIDDGGAAEVLVIGTLAPGPILDALAANKADGRMRAPWDMSAASDGRSRLAA